MNEYHENYYDKDDRIVWDWVVPIVGFAAMVYAIIWLVQNFS